MFKNSYPIQKGEPLKFLIYFAISNASTLNYSIALLEYRTVGVLPVDILYTLDSASLLVKLKPRIFQRLPPFE
jgi:hypothetical protein